MLHPAATLRNSKIEGKGLVAARFMPKGTIFWKSSRQDRIKIYSLAQYRTFSPRYRKTIDRFSYPNEDGKLVLSLDDDKHWNHGCDANVLDFPGASMCIVVKDIQPGEEITYDYALNLRENLSIRCHCKKSNCRKTIKRAKKDSALYMQLLKEEKAAVKNLKKVPQPLLTKKELEFYGKK